MSGGLYRFLYRCYWATLRPIKHAILGNYQIWKISNSLAEDEVAVTMTNAIGDDIYGLAYLRAFKNTFGVKIVLYGLKSKAKLYDNYGDTIERKVYFNKTEAEWKRIQSISMLRKQIRKSIRHKIYPILMHQYYHQPEHDDGNDFLEVLRKDVFNLAVSDAIIQYPIFIKEPITTIKEFDKIKGRIVVINPYSSSMDNTMMNLYEKIAGYLLERDYIVYTNVIKTQEPVKNTIPLDCSIYEFYAICNQIPMVISTRSGILDLVISSNTNFLVYYLPFVHNGWRFDNDVFFHRYTLKAWGTNNVTEHMVEDDTSAYKFFIDYMAGKA